MAPADPEARDRVALGGALMTGNGISWLPHSGEKGRTLGFNPATRGCPKYDGLLNLQQIYSGSPLQVARRVSTRPSLGIDHMLLLRRRRSTRPTAMRFDIFCQ